MKFVGVINLYRQTLFVKLTILFLQRREVFQDAHEVKQFIEFRKTIHDASNKREYVLLSSAGA